jgi:proteasome lid subunit RPN8/RPN11/outer membrane murein-binding lipoprotein Lpp
VIIKPEAYYKMLVHVLRFGAKTIRGQGYKEVMGILIGRLEGEGTIKDVIIEDAVPVSHGGSIEVRFAPEDYATFSMIDEKFAKENLFSVGWFHSHPGLDIFFSSTDIMNQLGWQTPNPSAIGIVFDHTYLDRPGDLGFRTFRLDDPSKGEASGYHEVETIVEPPDNLKFYEKIISLISSVHTKEPPILELNEKPNLFGEILFPSDGDLMVEMPQISTEKIVNMIKMGFFNIIESLIEPVIRQYNKWSQNILKNISSQNLLIKRNLVDVKTTINDQLNEVQNTYSTKLKNLFNEMDYYIDDRFDSIDVKLETIEEEVSQLEQTLTDDISNKINIMIKEMRNDFSKTYQSNLTNLEHLRENISKSKEFFTQQEELLKKIEVQPEKIQAILKKEIGDYLTTANDDFNKNYENLNKIINNSEERAEKVESKLADSLSILESSVEPLEQKINNLNTDKKVLQNKIDKATSQINEKDKKIESLENDNKNLSEEMKKEKKENEKLREKLKKLEKKVEKNAK